MRFCARVFAQHCERFFAAFITDEVSDIFQQNQLKRISRNWRLGIAVVLRELRDNLLQIQLGRNHGQ